MLGTAMLGTFRRARRVRRSGSAWRSSLVPLILLAVPAIARHDVQWTSKPQEIRQRFE